MTLVILGIGLCLSAFAALALWAVIHGRGLFECDECDDGLPYSRHSKEERE